LEINSGGSLVIQSGCNVGSTATLVIQAGGTLNIENNSIVTVSSESCHNPGGNCSSYSCCPLGCNADGSCSATGTTTTVTVATTATTAAVSTTATSTGTTGSTTGTTAPPATTACPSNDCGADPLPANSPLVAVCCDGTWTVFGNLSAAEMETIELNTNYPIIWDGDFDQGNGTTLVINVTSGGTRKRQSALSLLNVNGDANIAGPATVVLPSDVSPSLVAAPIPVAQTTGMLTGRFTNVSVQFPPGSCQTGQATQSSTGTSLSILVSVDTSNCGHSGLSSGAIAGIAVGATIGALLVIGVITVLVLRGCFPRTAEKLHLKKRSTFAVTAGSTAERASS